MYESMPNQPLYSSLIICVCNPHLSSISRQSNHLWNKKLRHVQEWRVICVSYSMKGMKWMAHGKLPTWISSNDCNLPLMVQVQWFKYNISTVHVMWLAKGTFFFSCPVCRLQQTLSAFTLSNTCPESHHDFNALSASNPSNNLPPKTCEARYRCGTSVARSWRKTTVNSNCNMHKSMKSYVCFPTICWALVIYYYLLFPCTSKRIPNQSPSIP
jgi:hypothetical protein